MNKLYDTILDTVGNTPIVRLNKLGPDGVNVWVKVESFNPMSSVKDRLALSVIEAAELRVEIGEEAIDVVRLNVGVVGGERVLHPLLDRVQDVVRCLRVIAQEVVLLEDRVQTYGVAEVLCRAITEAATPVEVAGEVAIVEVARLDLNRAYPRRFGETLGRRERSHITAQRGEAHPFIPRATTR